MICVLWIYQLVYFFLFHFPLACSKQFQFILACFVWFQFVPAHFRWFQHVQIFLDSAKLRTLQQVFVGLQGVFSVTIFRLPRLLEDALKTSWRHLARSLEDVLKTSSKRFGGRKIWRLRRLEDMSWRLLEDIFETCLEDIFKKS